MKVLQARYKNTNRKNFFNINQESKKMMLKLDMRQNRTYKTTGTEY